MLDQVPLDVQESLKQVFDLSFRDVDVRVEPIQVESSVPVPASRVSRRTARLYGMRQPRPLGMRRVVGRFRGRRSNSTLKVVGATIGETIYIDPAYAEWDSAAGQALLAHERLHLEQKRTIRNFDQLYAEQERVTPEDSPWENPYEYAAYLKECQVFYSLIKRGMPSGSWIPLGAQIGLCRA